MTLVQFAARTASALLGRLSTRFRIVFMGDFDHCSRSTFVRSHTHTLSVSILIHPKCVVLIEVRTLCRPVRFIHTRLCHSCLYGPCFVDWCTVMLEGARSKLSPQSWEHGIDSAESWRPLRTMHFSIH